VPGFDYINPALWTASYIEISQSIYGAELERRRKLERMASFKRFTKILSNITDMVEYTGRAYSIGIQLAVGTVVVALTGGSAAGMIATISNTVSANTNIGKSDLGIILAKVGQAYAIANITDAAVEQVVRSVIEQEAVAIIKREVAQETGLDQSIVGRIVVDISVGTGYGMAKDKGFYEALSNVADKTWRLQAAKESPIAAIIIAGATEIEVNNAETIDSDDPEEWYQKFNWEKRKLWN